MRIGAAPLRRLPTVTAGSSAPTAHLAGYRHFHPARPISYPYKDSQDRESLKPDRSEETSSGHTGDVVDKGDAAFDPTKTRPGSEKKAASAGGDGNPLDVSGANPAVSKPHGDNPAEAGKKAGAGKKADGDGGASGGGSGPKSGAH